MNVDLHLTEQELVHFIGIYIDEQKRILSEFPIGKVTEAAKMVFECYDLGRTIFAMGNGGNAGTVDHLFCDFKHHPFVSEDKSTVIPTSVKRLKFVNLCASPAELTGLVNDLGSDLMFAGALAPLVEKNDLVMGFSGSGNSKNVIRAFEVAKKAGARTLAISKGNGGMCLEVADLCIVIPGHSTFPGQTGKNDNNFHFEDAVLYIGSILVGLLKEKISRTILS